MGALDRHSAAAFGLAPCRQVTLVVIPLKEAYELCLVIVQYVIRS